MSKKLKNQAPWGIISSAAKRQTNALIGQNFPLVDPAYSLVVHLQEAFRNRELTAEMRDFN